MPRKKKEEPEKVFDPNSNSARVQARDLQKRWLALVHMREDMNEEIKELFAEARKMGFDVKTLRKVFAEARRDPGVVREEDEMRELYRILLDLELQGD